MIKSLRDILQIQVERIAELEEQLSHLADIHTKNQLHIRQLESRAGSKSRPNSRGM